MKSSFKEIIYSFNSFFKWVIISIICGGIIGCAGVAFFYAMQRANNLRAEHPWLVFTLPVGGLAIVGFYHLLGNKDDKGTNLILSSVDSGDAVPLKMAPCIVFGTIITHLCGGSAGREGAALQLGGSIASGIGRLVKLSEDDMKTITMCGMSACFSALFGTSMAASVFPLEVVSVGVFHYSALVPCVISSLIASAIARKAGLHPESFKIDYVPPLDIKTCVIITALALLCAVISIMFCLILHFAGHKYKQYFKNQYARVAAGGVIVLIMTLLVGDQSYNGAGISFIETFFETGQVFPLAFILKMVFTAATLGAGFKGGEIVPTFYIGAAFGTLFGMITGFDPGLCTAVGMCAVFCGVTNSPITSLLIAFELFGYEAMPYYLIAVAIADRLSGYYSLYGSQKIMYSKVSREFIDRNAQ